MSVSKKGPSALLRLKLKRIHKIVVMKTRPFADETKLDGLHYIYLFSVCLIAHLWSVVRLNNES